MTPYEFQTSLFRNVISSVETSAVAIVKSLKAHTFPSRIVNFPKTQDIKGTVVVGNQGKVEKQLQKNEKILSTILASIRGFVIPKKFEVTNFPKFPEIPKPLSEVSVKNFPKIPDYPKEIKISNQPIEQLESITLKGSEIVKAIKSLKLDPTIRVEAPKTERVVIPAPTVTVNEKEIDYEKLADAVSSKIPEIDYSKLSKSIGEVLARGLISTGGSGGGRSKALLDSKNRTVTAPDYFIADEITVDGTTYTGNQAADGRWYLMRVASNPTVVRYASSSNNPDIQGYVDAWDSRESLEYDYPSEVNF